MAKPICCVNSFFVRLRTSPTWAPRPGIKALHQTVSLDPDRFLDHLNAVIQLAVLLAARNVVTVAGFVLVTAPLAVSKSADVDPANYAPRKRVDALRCVATLFEQRASCVQSVDVDESQGLISNKYISFGRGVVEWFDWTDRPLYSECELNRLILDWILGQPTPFVRIICTKSR